MTKKFAVLLFAFLSSAASLSAQTYGLPGSQPVDPTGYYINQSFWSNKAFQTAMNNSLRGTGRGRPNSRTAPAGPTGVTAFRQSADILPAARGAGDPEAARLVRQALDLYRKTAASDGFPANDLAYAFEYFVVNNYQIYHHLLDIHADPSVTAIDDPLARLQAIKVKEQMKVTIPQERRIYEQFRQVLSENAEIKKMSDRQKQEVAELLALATGVAYMQFSQGSLNRSQQQMQKGREAARTNLEKLLGSPAQNIRITNSGLQH